MKTLLEKMMRLARDLVDSVTFCFNEEFYLFFFKFSGASSVCWLDSHHSSASWDSLAAGRKVLMFGSHASL